MTSRYKWKIKLTAVTFIGFGFWFEKEAFGFSFPLFNIYLEKEAY